MLTETSGHGDETRCRKKRNDRIDKKARRNKKNTTGIRFRVTFSSEEKTF